VAQEDFETVQKVMEQLHEAGLVNLDKSVREMLSPKESLARLRGGDEVATSVIAWDGYGLVIKSALTQDPGLRDVASQLRRATGGGG
jgi:hypothetical protein